MNVLENSKKAVVVWRAMHLSALVTLVGIFAMAAAPNAANGIGIGLGSFQMALGGFVSMYNYAQGKIDEKRGPVPRASGTVGAVDA